ncbi:MAG: hypothetical protein B5M55_04895 [Desulfococcus sp. 4484_242]|nr:MAG: hypothetical protein B5M55_04895 [Desulfococcus sp. 4484_242]
MSFKIWLINLMLIIAAALAGIEVYGVWSNIRPSEPPKRSASIASKKEEQRPVETIARTPPPPEEYFEPVVAKNLFSPDRTAYRPETSDSPEPALTAEAEKNLKGLSLYGVVIANDCQKALVMDKLSKNRPFPGKAPRRGPGRDETLWVKVGDVMGDFTVTAIAPDKISLSAGGATYDLFLHDKENPKSRSTVKTASAPTVVVRGGDLPRPAPASTTQPAAKPRPVSASRQGGGAGTALKPASGTPAPGQPAVASGKAARNPFQHPAAAQPSAGAVARSRGNASEAAKTNPFLRALRNRGIIPKQ